MQEQHAAVDLAGLRQYELQVGGHGKSDGVPASLKDGQGRFLKKLQAGERGDREVAFYQAMEAARQAGTAAAAADDDDGDADALHQPQQAAADGAAVLQELAQWVPCSFGVRLVAGVPYLVLDDAAGGFSRPCILDVKVGRRTWYPWASAALQEKYRSKDESTTQAGSGFRLCGLLVQSCDGQHTWRADRHWGKQLTADTVQQALARFADNGCLSLAELAHGPGMLLDQLRRLAAVFERQAAWHCYSASVLVVYEGAARSTADARLRVRLIDFAHTFPTQQRKQQPQKQQQQQQQQQQQREEEDDGRRSSVPTGIDTNFLQGLRSLIAAIEAAAQPASGMTSVTVNDMTI